MTRSKISTVRRFAAFFILVILALTPLLSTVGAASSPVGALPIKHIIIIVEENHTFDNYFGTYPGANGLSNAVAQPLSKNSSQLVRPFEINSTTLSGQPCETWVCAHEAYDGGKMDGFVTANGGQNLTMGYFNPQLIPYYWDYASQFVLLDNFFSAAMTNSLANHLYLIAGQSGGLVNDSRFGRFNFTSSTVHNSTFYFKSIADELDARHVSWKYYAGGYTSLNNWNPLPAFESFKTNQSLTKDLADPSQFSADVKAAKLPSVVWMMPETDQASEHPPYNITTGESAVVSAVNTVMSSPYWNSTAIFITWDDWGGWYDHVTPPQVDQYGYGFRVPLLIISPYAKQGFIDHTQGDFTSILKFIETVFSLPALTSRDASAGNLMEAFDFSQAPHAPLVLPGPFIPDHYPLTYQNGTLVGDTISTETVSATTFTVTDTGTLSASTVTSTVTVTTPSPGNAMTGPAGPDLEFAALLIAVFVVGSLVVLVLSKRTGDIKTMSEYGTASDLQPRGGGED